MRRLLLLTLFAVIFATFSVASEIPFTYENGFILVQANVAGSQEHLTFLVDSGASATVMHVRTAKRLHLALGRCEAVHGVSAQAAAYHFSPTAISANGEPMATASMAVDLRSSLALCGRQIDGLIGVDFFQNRVVQIDYTARQLRVLAAPPEATEAVQRLPLRQINGIYCAGISVNDSQPRWTRLDTGCNDPLHWVVPRSSPRARGGATIGFIDRQQNVVHSEVRLGDWSLSKVETSLHGEPLFPGEAGLLGNGVLSRYVVTVDGAHGALYLAR